MKNLFKIKSAASSNIQTKLKMNYCVNCGAEIPDYASVCEECYLAYKKKEIEDDERNPTNV